MHLPWVRLSVVAERLPAEDGLDSGPIELAVCGDALVEQAHASLAGEEPFVRAAYGGITLGWMH